MEATPQRIPLTARAGQARVGPLAPKGPGHDQRRCRFLVPNPAFDRSAIPEGVDRTRLPLFLCLAKGRPLISTMRKCKFCRETGLWYQPREDSPDALPVSR
jgi:hypothetical protein